MTTLDRPQLHSEDGQHRAVLDLAAAAEGLARQETTEEALTFATFQARALVPGCDDAAVQLAPRHERPRVTATGERAEFYCRLQVETGEGPSVTARQQNTPIATRDLALDDRWPLFAPAAVRHGVRGVVTVPLSAPQGVSGTLSLLTGEPGVLDARAQALAHAFATLTGVALSKAELIGNLRVGMQTREQIGHAVGILMERHRVRSDQAFELLVVASQQAHVKLRDVAAWVTETGQEPHELVPARRARVGSPAR